MGKRAHSFLFTTFEAGGCVGPAVCAGERLLRRGHRVRVISDEANRAEIEGAGLEFVPWRDTPTRADRSRHSDIVRDWAVAEPAEGLIMMIEKIMGGPAAIYARETSAELEREPADLVVGNDFLAGVLAACESRGQACAVLASQVSIFPQKGVPPLGPGFAPARKEEERALHAEVGALLTSLYDRGLPALNAARSSLGLAPLAHMQDQFTRVRRTFLATAKAFDFAPENPPERLRYVGPLLGRPVWVPAWTPPWRSDDPRPQVAVAFSTTFQNHAAVLQRVMDAAAGLPVRVVVTLGGSIEAHELRPPENARLVDKVDHDRLMAESAVVVTHGGHGTVMRALLQRRPLLVMPHGRDQNDNAVRVTERGAGLRLPAEAEAGEIRAALERLLGEPAFERAADELGARIAGEVAASPIIEELEALAADARGF